MKTYLLILGLFIYPTLCFTQDSLEKQKHITLNGYIKSLQLWSFPGSFEQISSTNLIHNRINMRLSINKNLQGAVSFRNRIFWGDDVRQIPDYTMLLRNKDESMNLSKTWLHTSDRIAHTNTERLWVQYEKNRWSVRVGRQRIHWGMATIWNPGDLFNTYNFLDVDFEERPGTDAIKLQYQLDGFSVIEGAFHPGKDPANSILAFRLSHHLSETDLQFIMAKYHNRYTLGAGWAGRLGDAGWKGELQYFFRDNSEKSHTNATMEIDYVCTNGWYISGSFLYNSEGVYKNNFADFSYEISPLQLMPFRWNLLVTSSKEITPLFRFTTSVFFAPGSNACMVLPQLFYSIHTDWDLDLLWQSFFAEQTSFRALNHRGFLRLRWSF